MALAMLAATALAGTGPAAAQTRDVASAESETLAFDVPRSSLQAALERYSVVTRLQILYSDEVVSGKQAGPVRGRFTPEVALALLLRGSGLRVRRTGPRSITLLEVAHEANNLPVLAIRPIRVEAPPTGGNPLFVRYAERLVAIAARAIQRDPITGRGDYTVRVRLWLAPDGRIRHTEMSRASRGAAQAIDISRVFRSVTIGEPPPPGMGQPLIYDFRIGHPG